MRIPFNRPHVSGRESEYIQQVITRRRFSGDGDFTARCNRFLEQHLGIMRGMLTTSCTHALEMCALLLNLRPGDEVIMPSYTFVSTANAVVLRGARPVFVDVREDTINLDERALEAAVTPRTRAVFVVHYAGVSCAMDEIMAIADRVGVPVVEDAAHAIGGRYMGRALGSIGDLGTYSFHESKNITCGEGGALLINNPEYVERAEIIREKGTDRSRFFRGEVDKYGWQDVGSSYLPSELLAAWLYAQLEDLERVNRHRRQCSELYRDGLADLAASGRLNLPVVPDGCESSNHLFHVLLPPETDLHEVIRAMGAQDILCTSHYVPLHLSPKGRSFGYQEGDFPVTEDISCRLLRLPLYNTLTSSEIGRVVQALREIV